ncbi:MAG: hypothetical protein U1F56_21080 [Rubrivivax sp.]
MHRSLLGLALSTALCSALIAGCASAPETSAPTPQADKGSAASFTDTTPLTGSRFAKTGTDRTVRVIGNEAARTDVGADVRSLSNTVGARGN